MDFSRVKGFPKGNWMGGWSAEDTAQTKEAIQVFLERTTASPEAANTALVELGTHTPAGNLTQRYR